MRRAGLAAVFVCIALAGASSAAVIAGPLPLLALTTGSTSTGTAATTTGPAATRVTNTKPKPKPKPRAKPRYVRIAKGVTVAGIRVAGMSRPAAEARVRRALARALPIRAGNLRRLVAPRRLGLRPYVHDAVTRALKADPGDHVKVFVVVQASATRVYVRTIARRFHRDPIDSRLSLHELRPFVSKGERGRDILREPAVRAIVFALTHNQRRTVNLPVRRIPQSVSRSSIGPVIVIRRGSNTLSLYDGMRVVRTFGVATGQSSYPTPLGLYAIVEMWRDPWWIPPDSPWAKGARPVPPGPGNPLGTRWMGLTAPGVGIHGTPDPGSIGYSVSHGCIRMYIPDAEWLFQRVRIGVPVYIVSR